MVDLVVDEDRCRVVLGAYSFEASQTLRSIWIAVHTYIYERWKHVLSLTCAWTQSGPDRPGLIVVTLTIFCSRGGVARKESVV
jgi:hypothetical protein